MAKRVAIRFPAYVPTLARVSLKRRIDLTTGTDPSLVSDWLCKERAALERLATDSRMKEAYGCLTSVLGEERPWERIFLSSSDVNQRFWEKFFFSATHANQDFGAWRTQLKRVMELKNGIAAKANQIIKQLAELSDLASQDELRQTDYQMNWPDGLFRLPELCFRKNIDIEAALERERLARLADKGITEIDLPSDAPATKKGRAKRKTKLPNDTPACADGLLDILFESSQTLVAIDALTPRAIDVVSVISKAANEWEPQLYFEAGAAMVSRKNTPKVQYIRAFWYSLNSDLLSRKPFDPPSADLLKAIAITADVVLNDANDSIGVPDVRHALKHPSAG
ncbi:MAG: hypothetical protein ACKVP7_17310 [Hyphomicrobiaceae bacterium]